MANLFCKSYILRLCGPSSLCPNYSALTHKQSYTLCKRSCGCNPITNKPYWQKQTKIIRPTGHSLLVPDFDSIIGLNMIETQMLYLSAIFTDFITNMQPQMHVKWNLIYVVCIILCLLGGDSCILAYSSIFPELFTYGILIMC